jgi:DNA repair protein RadC
MPHVARNSSSLDVRDAATFRPAMTQETLNAARAALSAKFRRGRPMTSPEAIRDYRQVSFGLLEREVFVVVLLDLCVANSYVQRCSLQAQEAFFREDLLHMTSGCAPKRNDEAARDDQGAAQPNG